MPLSPVRIFGRVCFDPSSILDLPPQFGADEDYIMNVRLAIKTRKYGLLIDMFMTIFSNG